LWSDYIKNTEGILSYKNNFPMAFLTKDEEKKLLEESGCSIKDFSYKEVKNKFYSDKHRELQVRFTCRNGITGDIYQYKDNGGKFGGYGGSRHINLHKKHTSCRISFKDSSKPKNNGFCWTRGKFSLGQ
jgi:hypothetical protein